MVAGWRKSLLGISTPQGAQELEYVRHLIRELYQEVALEADSGT
jgi:hypothetical protein